MKKVVSYLAILSLIVVLIVPSLVSAQVSECCKLRRDIEVRDKTYQKDLIVGFRSLKATECRFGAVDEACTDTDGNGIIDQTTDCYSEDRGGSVCLINTIYSITDWIFYILMAFVGIMIIIGAFTIITAGGSPEKVTSGRNYVLYAVIGMVVAFFARAIPAIVKTVIGM
jgi:hypothetical protein